MTRSETRIPKASGRYQIAANIPFSVCSPYVAFLSLIHDKPLTDTEWEAFTSESLPKYFTDGILALRSHLDRLADLSQPHTLEDDKSLWFMVESLIQARRLIDETRANTDKKEKGKKNISSKR